MASIKVNYRGRNNRTSTTFTEIMARYFICAWYNMQRGSRYLGDEFLIHDKEDPLYRDTEEVKKVFQSCITEMTNYVDKSFLASKDVSDFIVKRGWTKTEVETYMLIFIKKEAEKDYIYDQFID